MDYPENLGSSLVFQAVGGAFDTGSIPEGNLVWDDVTGDGTIVLDWSHSCAAIDDDLQVFVHDDVGSPRATSNLWAVLVPYYDVGTSVVNVPGSGPFIACGDTPGNSASNPISFAVTADRARYTFYARSSAAVQLRENATLIGNIDDSLPWPTRDVAAPPSTWDLDVSKTGNGNDPWRLVVHR
ncbi:MAG: hypothetical protein H6734_18400 [Alphaproteobacteria bacterium]|nr:hypothetical protein [Alphaproteobacteria bacterium]